MIAVVNPRSSGLSFVAALRERGVDWVVVHEPTARNVTVPAGAADVIEHHAEHTATTASRLRELGVSAVVPGSESGVTPANDLAVALGVAHNHPGLASARRDKADMARAVSAAGLPVPFTSFVRTQEQLQKSLARLDTYPVVLKPRASSGSDGLSFPDTPGAASDAFERMARRENQLGLPNDGALLQEHLEGTLYVVNTVSANGAHALTEIYRKRVDRVAGVPLTRHLQLCTAPDAAERDLVRYAYGCLDAVGISTGAAHTELVLTNEGPRLVEVNARLMGPLLPADVFVPALGYSQATALAQRYLDEAHHIERVEAAYRPVRCVAQAQLRTGQRGVVRGTPGIDRVRRLPGYAGAAKLPVPGQRIADAELTTAANGICYFSGPDQVVADSLDQLHRWEDCEEIFEVASEHPVVAP